MLTSALVAFAHFAAAFGVAATIFYEWFTFSRAPTLAEARRLALADLWYGICAGVVLLAGFGRALHFEKGWAFYQASPFFSLKLGLFLLVGLLSIYPTVQFIRWRGELKAGRAPQLGERQYRLILACLRAEALGVLAILLSASLMAHGVGV